MDASSEVSEIMQECRQILRVGEIIQGCRSILSADALDGVDHYYTHNEREMAFEGLVLDLMKADVVPPSYDFEEWCDLARDLGLEEDSVFDGYFCAKFIAWGKTKRA